MLARLEAGIGRFVLSELCDSVRDEEVVSRRHGEHRGRETQYPCEREKKVQTG
jgi:hypothetical protein